MRRWQLTAILWTLSLFMGVTWRCYLAERPEAIMEQAQKYAMQGNVDEAELALRRVIARKPGRVDARLLLGKLAHSRNQSNTVAAVFREIPDSEPMAGPIRVAEGDAWLSLNQARLAEDCWTRAYHLAPDDTQPRRRLTYLYGLQLRRELWSKFLWELYDRGEAGLREMIQLMIAEHVVWAPEESLERVQAFALADRQDIHSRRALAEYQLLSGDMNGARTGLDSILAEYPSDVSSRLLAIELHLANADVERTRRALDELPQSARSDWRAHKHRGSLALLQHRFADAIGEFRLALSHAPFDRELRYKINQAQRLAGDFDAADRDADFADRLANIHRLCHALHSQPTPSPEQLRRMVQLCEELGLIEEAIGWVRVGLEQDETDPFLLAARERLAGVDKTSSRHPPQPRQDEAL